MNKIMLYGFCILNSPQKLLVTHIPAVGLLEVSREILEAGQMGANIVFRTIEN
jgi:hypothetical protein